MHPAVHPRVKIQAPMGAPHRTPGHTKHVAQLETIALLKGQQGPRESQIASKSQFPFANAMLVLRHRTKGPALQLPQLNKRVKQLQHQHPTLPSSHRRPAPATPAAPDPTAAMGTGPTAPGTPAPGEHGKPWRCPPASGQLWGKGRALQYLGERTHHTVGTQPAI